MSFQLPPGMRPAQPPQQGGGGGGGGPSGSGGQGQSEEGQREAQDKARAQEEMKRGMIASMLAPEARERLSRIALTRPELASRVEDLLIRMGQAGQIRGQVTDEAMKGLLQQVTDVQPPKPSAQPSSARVKSLGSGITIHRKNDDSDSDEYDL